MELLGSREIPSLEYLSEGRVYVEQITSLVAAPPLFANFSLLEVEVLVDCMKVYRVQPGIPFIHEGDPGSFMAIILDGKVEIRKRHPDGLHKAIAAVGRGKILGEMAIVDDEPRFATCVGINPVTFAVLSRDDFLRILKEHPKVGSKILWQLVVALNTRVRQLSNKLLPYM